MKLWNLEVTLKISRIVKFPCLKIFWRVKFAILKIFQLSKLRSVTDFKNRRYILMHWQH